MNFNDLDLTRPFYCTERPGQLMVVDINPTHYCACLKITRIFEPGIEKKTLEWICLLLLQQWEFSQDPFSIEAVAKCECGAEKCKTTHAHWCPMHRDWKEMG